MLFLEGPTFVLPIAGEIARAVGAFKIKNFNVGHRAALALLAPPSSALLTRRASALAGVHGRDCHSDDGALLPRRTGGRGVPRLRAGGQEGGAPAGALRGDLARDHLFDGVYARPIGRTPHTSREPNQQSCVRSALLIRLRPPSVQTSTSRSLVPSPTCTATTRRRFSSPSRRLPQGQTSTGTRWSTRWRRPATSSSI